MNKTKSKIVSCTIDNEQANTLDNIFQSRVFADDIIVSRFHQMGIHNSMLVNSGINIEEKYKLNPDFDYGFYRAKAFMLKAFRKSICELHQINQSELETIISIKNGEPFIEIIITPENNNAKADDNLKINR